MALDLYIDQPASAETLPSNRPVKPAWVGTLTWISLLAFIVVAVWIGLNRPQLDPDVDPSPGPVASGLHVLIVEETEDRDQMPAEQVAIFSSIPLREWTKTHCAQEDGHPAFRNFDKDDKLDRENEVWQKMRAKITLPPPVVLMIDGKRGKEMKLPANPEQLQQVLEQFVSSKR